MATEARVGGGQSYSGGGGSYSSSGSSGGGDGAAIGLLIELGIRLIFYYPQIGIPLLVVGGVWYYYNQASLLPTEYDIHRDWSAANTPKRSRSTTVEALVGVDANFSEPLFLDFVGLLYSRVQQSRSADLARVAAYLKPEVRESLSQQVDQVGDVIVGSIRLVELQGVGSPRIRLRVELETNYTEVVKGSAKAYYSVEEWVFGRAAGVLSQGPDQILELACPSCGNPGELPSSGICPYCDNRVNDGRFGWVVEAIRVKSVKERPPVVLSDTGHEVGNELPTRKALDLPVKRREFQVRYPEFSWDQFGERVKLTFLSLQQAWSTLQWEKARPFETDHLFESHRYWIEAYRAEGIQNKLEQIELQSMELSRIETDAFYDAITLRIWASMVDYTVRAETGEVVSGDPKKNRRFSEYWTFIRRSGHRRSESRDPNRCPNCGAPLDKVNRSGVCEYCQSKITRGDFDWVLSRIEQDEAYQA